MSDYLKEQEKLVWMLVAYSTCDCKGSKKGDSLCLEKVGSDSGFFCWCQ